MSVGYWLTEYFVKYIYIYMYIHVYTYLCVYIYIIYIDKSENTYTFVICLLRN